MTTMANGIGWAWRLGRAAAGQAAAWPAWVRPTRAAAPSLPGHVELGCRAKVAATRMTAGTAAEDRAGAETAGRAADAGESAAAMVRSVHPSGRLGLLIDRPLAPGTHVVVRFAANTDGRFEVAPRSSAQCVVRRCEPGGTGRVAFVVEATVQAVVEGV